MPVRRFHSVEDMSAAVPDRPFDPDNLRAAFALSRLCFGLGGKRLRPGVYKYRSITAANAARARRERDPSEP